MAHVVKWLSLPKVGTEAQPRGEGVVLTSNTESYVCLAAHHCFENRGPGNGWGSMPQFSATYWIHHHMRYWWCMWYVKIRWVSGLTIIGIQTKKRGRDGLNWLEAGLECGYVTISREPAWFFYQTFYYGDSSNYHVRIHLAPQTATNQKWPSLPKVGTEAQLRRTA